MRILLALTVALGMAGVALADTETDFAAANRIFGELPTATILDDIEGEWLPLSVLANLRGEQPALGQIDGYLSNFCGAEPGRGSEIVALDDASFTIEVPNSRADMVYRFDWIGGARFSRSIDPNALFDGLGMAAMEGESGTLARANALRYAQQPVQVYRFSPTILVIASAELAEIYGRCP